jgi:hypothetical protein
VRYAIIGLGAAGIVIGGVVLGMIMVQMPLMKDIGMLVVPAIILGVAVILTGLKLKSR